MKTYKRRGGTKRNAKRGCVKIKNSGTAAEHKLIADWMERFSK